jgi:uncharacterized GH25 family protein
MKLFRLSLAGALLLLSTSLLLAHDYWLLASSFILKKGQTLTLRLLVGDDLEPEEERVFQRHKTVSFQLHTATGTEDLLPAAKDSTLPVLQKRLDFNGLGLISMERNFSRLEMDSVKFHQYLIHEFLVDAMDAREQPGRKHRVERERYARAIKSLVQVGTPAATDATYRKRLGHKIELILLQNPYRLRPGDLLEAQLFFEGKPLVKKVLMALHKAPDGTFTELITYTDDEGIARFKLKRPGPWVLRTTHLLPCDDCPDVDWESFWTSYSFELPRG